MTVSELIAALQKMPGDVTVYRVLGETAEAVPIEVVMGTYDTKAVGVTVGVVIS